MSQAQNLPLLSKMLVQFRDARDWGQFHTAENLAKSIAIEAGELLECFQWSDDADLERVEDELADVAAYLILLSDRLGIDLGVAIAKKVRRNEKRFPADKWKGRASMRDGSQRDG